MRSTFIVGFPGEREEHVEYLAQWIERAQLDRVGFFAYSSEEGTSAAQLSGRISAKEKSRRLIRLREAQRQASQRARNRRIGRPARVLVEERRRLRSADPVRHHLGAAQVWYGRSMGEAPGVDGGIYFSGDAAVGRFCDVQLEWAGPFDYAGRVTKPSLTQPALRRFEES
ncbi:MAG: hypothetical protein JOZ59_04715 [Candidatus Eremiobacteraeota bacterium]|nr:hypothetical protein [Candidatus Eremiobacteraeota bacterium]